MAQPFAQLVWGGQQQGLEDIDRGCSRGVGVIPGDEQDPQRLPVPSLRGCAWLAVAERLTCGQPGVGRIRLAARASPYSCWPSRLNDALSRPPSAREPDQRRANGNPRLPRPGPGLTRDQGPR